MQRHGRTGHRPHSSSFGVQFCLRFESTFKGWHHFRIPTYSRGWCRLLFSYFFNLRGFFFHDFAGLYRVFFNAFFNRFFYLFSLFNFLFFSVLWGDAEATKVKAKSHETIIQSLWQRYRSFYWRFFSFVLLLDFLMLFSFRLLDMLSYFFLYNSLLQNGLLDSLNFLNSRLYNFRFGFRLRSLLHHCGRSRRNGNCLGRLRYPLLQSSCIVHSAAQRGGHSTSLLYRFMGLLSAPFFLPCWDRLLTICLAC
mmetsp:Transcript_8822/g.23888  ORF Transcript_8822/g.23888 Transcript_8822/m.23888 type:complete len:251 (+) Transcript_8822:1123-1875(+)